MSPIKGISSRIGTSTLDSHVTVRRAKEQLDYFGHCISIQHRNNFSMGGRRTAKRLENNPAAPPLSVELPFKESKDKILRLKVCHILMHSSKRTFLATQALNFVHSVLSGIELRVGRCTGYDS